MAQATPETDATIESLLEQRAQYEQWIQRLESAGEKAPPAVRQKVRTDYEARLQGVIQQLRGHAATINAELERHQSAQGNLDRERRTAEEALSEAEVRFAVGEFSDEEWNRISDEAQELLERLRGELRVEGDEIARLAEVQQLISAPRRPAPAPVAAAPVAAAPGAPQALATTVTHQMYELEAEPEPVSVSAVGQGPAHQQPAPREPAPQHASVSHTPAHRASAPQASAPPAASNQGPGNQPRTAGEAQASPAAAASALDEMTFLKSVSEEERPAASQPSRRPSNPGTGAQGRAEGAAPAAPSGPAPMSSAPAASAASSPSKGGPAGVAKTLKCGECATLNRPTEWYCERCGAELAAM